MPQWRGEGGEKVDRRTFLVNTVRTGAVAVAAGSVGFYEWEVFEPGSSRSEALPGPPRALSTNGEPTPVGVDPDDVSFAWQVADPRRGAVQTAYRLTVNRSGTSATTVWDSGRSGRAGRPSCHTQGRRSTPTPHTDSVLQPATPTGHGVPIPRPPASSRDCARADWKAQWLRPGPKTTGLDRYTYLRTTFDLPDGTIDHAVVYTAAAHKYQLWVNGQKLDTGPSFCYPDEQYVQATDVSAAVVAGARNGIGFLHHWYSAGKGRPQSVPGLLAQLSVHFTDGRRFVVGTDGTWTQRPAEWLPAAQRNTDAGDFVEIIDARSAPSGWSEASYDDGGWTKVAVMGPVGTAPFTKLYAQRTRISELALTPASVTTLDDGAVVIDFGKIYAGAPDGGVPRRHLRAHRVDARRVRPRPWRACLHHPRDAADQPGVLLHTARRGATIRSLHVSGFSISRDRSTG